MCIACASKSPTVSDHVSATAVQNLIEAHSDKVSLVDDIKVEQTTIFSALALELYTGF